MVQNIHYHYKKEKLRHSEELLKQSKIEIQQGSLQIL